MRLPKLAVVDVLDAFPDSRLGAVLLPAGAEMAIVEARHLRREPRRHMHAVGDMSDGHAVFRLCRDSGRVHIARETSPCSAETALARRATRKPSTVMQKSSSLIAGILAAHVHQPIVRQAKPFAQRSEMLFDQVAVEAIVPGGHRRVRGENDFARNARHRCVEAQTFFLHAIVNRFEHDESAVPFVQVQHAGRDAHRFQSARKPPTPSSNSWRMRMRRSPP